MDKLSSATRQHQEHTAALDAEMDLEAAPDSATYVDSSDADERHPSRGRCCVRYGRTWILYSCSSDYGYFPLTAHIGPHWMFMLATYAISIGPVFLVLLSDDFNVGFQAALVVSSILTTVVFSLVACSDPGVIYDNNQPLRYLSNGDNISGGGVICAQCQVRRPKTASHCSDCGVCVNKLDHHCPWTGKCIGVRTLWLFYAFIWCVSVHVVLLSIGCTITYIGK